MAGRIPSCLPARGGTSSIRWPVAVQVPIPPRISRPRERKRAATVADPVPLAGACPLSRARLAGTHAQIGMSVAEPSIVSTRATPFGTGFVRFTGCCRVSRTAARGEWHNLQIRRRRPRVEADGLRCATLLVPQHRQGVPEHGTDTSERGAAVKAGVSETPAFHQAINQVAPSNLISGDHDARGAAVRSGVAKAGEKVGVSDTPTFRRPQ